MVLIDATNAVVSATRWKPRRVAARVRVAQVLWGCVD